jgi:hypothetical protein
MEKDLVKVYVYDKNLQPVPKNKLKDTAVGSIAFPRDKNKREVVFTLKDTVYEAKIPSISAVHRFDLHVNFLVDGKEVLGDFGVDNIH